MKPIPTPPNWILQFLRWFCPDHLLEEIEGDLQQKFEKDVSQFGIKKAKGKFAWNALRYLRPGIIFRSKGTFRPTHLIMLTNYFKISYRHLVKNKVFTTLNIIGLSVGITAFFMILLYINFETSYDQFHQNKDAIYRIGLKRFKNNELQHASVETFAGIRSLIKDNFPEIEAYTGFFKTPANTGFLFRYKDKIYNEPGGVLNPDSSFFKVFPSLLVRGNPSIVLNEKNKLVISESMAKKIFGTADPIGQTIERIDDYDEGLDFTVTGVLKDIPENSHFHVNFVRNIEDTWPDIEYWKQDLIYTYITLAQNSNPDRIESRINSMLRKLESENPQVKGSMVFLQPMSEIHLSSHFNDELEANGNKALLYILAFIGLAILGMAWINFINLETARSITRLKEAGVRRVIGSGKSDLTLQFLIEFFCLTTGAVLVAIFFLSIGLRYFRDITGIPITNFHWAKQEVWTTGLGILAVGSIIVGAYPAFFLLKSNPIEALKGRINGRGRGGILRKSLIIVQFTVSLVLIAFVLVVREQVDFMRSTNKNIEIERVIALRNPTAYSNQELESKYNSYEVFENKLLQNTRIKIMASSSAIPGTEIGFNHINRIKRNQDDPFDPTIFKLLFVNQNYIPLYGLKIMAGHNFPSPYTDKSWIEPWQNRNWTNIILSESAIRQLGFHSPEEAIGQAVDFRLFGGFLKYKIIGVVEDYHHEAIKKETYPTIFVLNFSTFQQVYYSIKLNTGINPQEALAYIEKSWKEIFPEKPFEYFFLDDYYDHQFKSELRFGKVFKSFAGIALLIACLGIFGITLFEANSRLREISIRKVLGARVLGLIGLLSEKYFKLTLASIAISFPLIYYCTALWLEDYPARISFKGSFFIWPLMTMTILVMVISGITTYKAANSNPVDHLKNE